MPSHRRVLTQEIGRCTHHRGLPADANQAAFLPVPSPVQCPWPFNCTECGWVSEHNDHRMSRPFSSSVSTFFTPVHTLRAVRPINDSNTRKSARRRRKHCALAVVRRSQKFRPSTDPFPGAWDGQNLISWR